MIPKIPRSSAAFLRLPTCNLANARRSILPHKLVDVLCLVWEVVDPQGLLPLIFGTKKTYNTPLLGQILKRLLVIHRKKTLCQGSLKRKGVPMGGVPKWCSGNLRVLFQWLISAQKEHADLCLHVWMILLIERSSFHQIVFHHRTIGWKTEFLLK